MRGWNERIQSEGAIFITLVHFNCPLFVPFLFFWGWTNKSCDSDQRKRKRKKMPTCVFVFLFFWLIPYLEVYRLIIFDGMGDGDGEGSVDEGIKHRLIPIIMIVLRPILRLHHLDQSRFKRGSSVNEKQILLRPLR